MRRGAVLLLASVLAVGVLVTHLSGHGTTSTSPGALIALGGEHRGADHGTKQPAPIDGAAFAAMCVAVLAAFICVRRWAQTTRSPGSVAFAPVTPLTWGPRIRHHDPPPRLTSMVQLH